MIGLPVASTSPKHRVGRGELESHAIYLGKWVRLMAPQDHSLDTIPRVVLELST